MWKNMDGPPGARDHVCHMDGRDERYFSMTVTRKWYITCFVC